MTEQEWLKSPDPERLLDCLPGKASDRKLRLFACACCRHIWPLQTDGRSRRAVEIAEQFADGEVTLEDLQLAYEDAAQASRNAHDATFCPNDRTNEYPSSAANFASDTLQFWDMHHAASVCAADVEWAISVAINIKGYSGPNPRKVIREVQTALLREIFGNPFRPITINPACLAWNDGTVRRIAQSICEECAFDRLPILADALQDAGCDNEDILNHCRSEGPHVRGCWVVDLLLGKQ